MTETTRRTALALLAATLAAGAARAQAPTVNRLARILLGFPPGGSSDVTARLLAEKLRGGYAPNLIVENRAGAGGRLAIEALKAADPDGTTLLQTPASMITIYPHLYPGTLRYDPFADVIPVTPVAEFAFALSVGPGAPGVTSLAGLIAFAKARGGLHFGSPAAGSAPHFIGLELGKLAGFEAVHVPYRGGAPAIQDLMGGQLPASMNVISEALPQHEGGRIRIIAITGAQRFPQLPDVPTFAELGFGALTIAEWFGVFLPARTPAPVVAALNAQLGAAVQAPDVVQAFARLGFAPAHMTPEAFAARVRAEHAAWGPIVAASGFRPEE
jgi:tripartite-type tricarboxylate transporter receptor subunit TctC